jgi:predicted nuclease of restriction endonuclease-like (RecB) superfamily
MIDYHNDIDKFLENLGDDVIFSKNASLIAVNKNMFMLYWRIGNLILEKQNQGCGDEFISTLAQYFRIKFPDNLGFSEKNLKSMVKFASEYESQNFVENTASRISWSCNMVILDRIKDINKRMEYADKVLEKGWTVEELIKKIDLQYGIEEEVDEEVSHNDTMVEQEQPFENKDIITSETDCGPEDKNNGKKEDAGAAHFIKDIVLTD